MKINVPIEFRDCRKTITIKTPSKCPHCGRTMSPQYVGQSISSDEASYLDEGRFAVVFSMFF